MILWGRALGRAQLGGFLLCQVSGLVGVHGEKPRRPLEVVKITGVDVNVLRTVTCRTIEPRCGWPQVWAVPVLLTLLLTSHSCSSELVHTLIPISTARKAVRKAKKS